MLVANIQGLTVFRQCPGRRPAGGNADISGVPCALLLLSMPIVFGTFRGRWKAHRYYRQYRGAPPISRSHACHDILRCRASEWHRPPRDLGGRQHARVFWYVASSDAAARDGGQCLPDVVFRFVSVAATRMIWCSSMVAHSVAIVAPHRQVCPPSCINHMASIAFTLCTQ